MESISKYIIGVLLALLLIAGGAYFWQQHKFDVDRVGYQNKIAEQAETIKVKDGVVEKLAVQSENLKGLIDQTTEQGKKLEERLSETKSKLITVVNAQAELKKLVIDKGYTPTAQKDGTWKVDINERKGPLYATGYISGGPTINDKIYPRLTLGVDTLKLTITVSQNRDGSWSSDFAANPDVDVKIGVAAVNPLIFKPRWYEKINFNFQLAAGSNGLLAGAGAAYKFGNVSVGPSVFATTNAGTFYGASASWYPFETGK